MCGRVCMRVYKRLGVRMLLGVGNVCLCVYILVTSVDTCTYMNIYVY